MKNRSFIVVLIILFICPLLYFCTSENKREINKDRISDFVLDKELPADTKPNSFGVKYFFNENFITLLNEDIELLKSFDKPYADNLIKLRIDLGNLVERCYFEIEEEKDVFEYHRIQKENEKLLKELTFSEIIKLKQLDNNEKISFLSYIRYYFAYLYFRHL